MHASRLPLFATIVVALASVTPLAAQDAPPRDRITVTGEGEVSLVPDRAHLRAGVVTEGSTAREAGEANSRVMTAVVAAIKAAGIADKDIRTQRYVLQPVHGRPDGDRPRISGFQATNMVAVTIVDLGRTAEVIDRATEAGANSLGGIEFVVSDRSKALDLARQEAVADAKRRAETYAAAAGVTLGRPVAIVERDSGSPPPQPMAFARASGPATPILAGEATLRVSVTASFELLR